MRTTRWLLVMTFLVLTCPDLSAQFFPGPYGYGGYFRGGSIGYSRSWGRSPLSIGFGAFSAGGYGFGGFGPGWGWGGYRGLTIVQVAAPPPPPVVIVQPAPPPLIIERQPVFILPPMPREPDMDHDGVPPVPDDRDPPPPPRPRPPVEPKKPDPQKEDPKKAPPRKDDAKKEAPKPRREGELGIPRHPGPAGNPRDEYDRLLHLGREAFLAQEYGRADQRFRQASGLRPDEAMPRFLRAQTLLALGKYHDAGDAILAGLHRDPDWPKARFRPIELYGDAVAEYTEQMRTLNRVLAQHPNDPVLLFLAGYRRWFDGRKVEARTLFRQARARFAAPDAIDRFLRALPPATL